MKSSFQSKQQGFFMTFFTKSIAIFCMVASSLVFAKTDPQITKKITEKMEMLNMTASSIKPSAIKDLYEVLTERGVFYVSADANYLIHGNVYDLNNEMENLTEKSLSKLRMQKLKAFESEMIVYKAENEKHVITVFTDTSCGYCKKLHSEMADYNRLGITVRYLAYPRQGINSSTARTMVSIWCADDRNIAMDNSKNGKGVTPKTCKNTVKEQYELGQFFGVTGTPAIVLEDGTLKPGYLPAKQLLEVIEYNEKG